MMGQVASIAIVGTFVALGVVTAAEAAGDHVDQYWAMREAEEQIEFAP